MQTQLRKDKTMKNSNNNTYMFKGNETIKSVNDASFMFGKYVCRELEAIGMRSSYRHVMKPLMEQDGMTQLELVNLTQLKHYAAQHGARGYRSPREERRRPPRDTRLHHRKGQRDARKDP